MSDMLVEQFGRLLRNLPTSDPWSELGNSGFLDLLVSESDGGGGADLEDLFPLALMTGDKIDTPPIIETMVARLVFPCAQNVSDVESFLEGLPSARPLAAAIAAAQMAGAMERVQSMTLEYARTRRQFGREISKFQVIQHYVAIMAEEVQAARIAAQAAFEGAPLQISAQRAGAAKLRAGEAAQRVGEIAHAVFGAIGISQELSLHRYTRQLRAWRMTHGGESWWAARLGEWALEQRSGATTLARML